MPPRANKEQQEKEAAEQARIKKEREEADAALKQAQKDDAQRTADQQQADEALARQQRDAAAAEERARVEAEQQAANEKLEQLKEHLKGSVAPQPQEPGDEQSDNKPGRLTIGEPEEKEMLARALAELSPDARLFKAGTVVHLNGEACTLPVDLPLVVPGGADEQHVASVLARDPQNFALNSDLLRLVYNPMNGTPLPLSGQRLTLEEMSPQERVLFDVPLPPAHRR